MLSLNNVEVVYDGVILVLKGVSLTVGQGQITTLLGANGAGKTTTLKAISGLLHAERGQVTKGAIELDGERLDRLAPHDIVGRGITQVFEGRRVFENLTVEENLVVGGHIQAQHAARSPGDRPGVRVFPDPAGTTPPAGRLSVGRRAADAGDRPRTGGGAEGDPARRALARAGAADRGEHLRHHPPVEGGAGQTVLLVEQNAALALELADHGYVMENGRIVLEGPAADLRENPEIKEFYLGLNEVGARRSYRDARQHRRRRRVLA